MNIWIDGNPVVSAAIRGQNLEDILGELQEDHVPQDRMVGEVVLNGRTYSEDLPHAALEVGRDEIDTLELFTRSSAEVAVHFMTHGQKIVDSMRASLPKITEMFRLGDEAEANEHYLRFLESLHLLMGMLEQVGGVMGIDFATPVDDQGSLNEHLQLMAQIVSQLLQIQEQNDWIYLADVLEYELTPLLEAIGGILPKLRGRSN